MKIVKILEEIKKLDIIIEKIVTIKLINGLDSFSEIYLTMLSQKARYNNKLPNLQAFLSNLENKKCRIKQITKINFAQSQSIGLSDTLSKDNSSLHR